jgi:hypothetical protein
MSAEWKGWISLLISSVYSVGGSYIVAILFGLCALWFFAYGRGME